MKYKVGDYIIYNSLIHKIVHVNKIFNKYSLRICHQDVWYLQVYTNFYGIMKVKEKDVKGLISF